MAIVISNLSIKNQVTTSITHIYTYNFSVIKTIHYAVNITSTKVELFAIRCGLNQAIWLTNIEYIIIITDLIHVKAKSNRLCFILFSYFDFDFDLFFIFQFLETRVRVE